MKHSTTFGNPPIPEAQPHLYIEDKVICQNLQTALKHTMAFPAYQKYLQQKLKWTNRDTKDVHWIVFSVALSSFQQEDQ